MRNFRPAAKSKTNRRKALEKNTAEIYLKVNRTDKTRNKPNNNKLQFRWEGTVVCNQASPTIQPSNHRTTQQPNNQEPQTDQRIRGAGDPEGSVAGRNMLDGQDGKVGRASWSAKVCAAQSASDATMKLEICHEWSEVQTITDRGQRTQDKRTG